MLEVNDDFCINYTLSYSFCIIHEVYNSGLIDTENLYKTRSSISKRREVWEVVCSIINDAWLLMCTFDILSSYKDILIFAQAPDEITLYNKVHQHLRSHGEHHKDHLYVYRPITKTSFSITSKNWPTRTLTTARSVH